MRKIHVLLLMGVEAVLLCAGVAVASRNSSGTMSAINGPYVAGTVISAATINARFSDIESEITDSLNRSGKGAMLAPVRLTNGTFAAPSLTFDSDTDTGLYRIGANNLGVAANGAKVLDVATTGLGVTGTFSATGAMSVTAAGATSAFSGLSGASGSATDISVGRTAAEGRLGLAAGANNYAAGSAAGDLILGSLGHNLFFDTNSGTGTPSLQIVSANGGVKIGGGTAVKERLVGTTTWNPGTVSACGAGPCLTVSTTISMSGVAASNPCYAGVYDPAPLSGWPVQCITTANTCSLMIVNQSNVNKAFGSATFYCVVEVL